MMLRAAAPPPRLYLNLNNTRLPRTITSSLLLPVVVLPQFRTAHSSHNKNHRHSPKPAVPRRAAEPITIPPPVLLSAYQSELHPHHQKP
ncbi:hypothetical protein B9Z19DRAFT_1075701 [Tuber borchii]|uniref:Uncharacterized protein n=1 Tax=Tuber borchii TaxID=42251 RepID=A0A2T7A2T0_TUBBO|nr:hypothetical protein B9Z19DRAFT_1075701 [Tuber borchii]